MPDLPDTARRRARRRRLLGWMALQLVLVPLLVELGLRCFAPVRFRQPHDTLSESQWATWSHRASAVPGLGYELVPGRTGMAGGMPVAVNALGLRDDEVELRKPPGTVRIAALGDSVTFGWMAGPEEAWPNRLEARLRARAPGGAPVEVLNLGVSGYNVTQSAAALVEKALPLDPDLVVFGYTLNDPETEPLMPLQLVFHATEWWEHSHLLRLLAASARSREMRRLGDGDLYRYLHAADGPHWPAVLAAFDRIRMACVARGIPVVLAIFPVYRVAEDWSGYLYADLQAQVAAAARARGFGVLELLPALARSGHGPVGIYLDQEHLNALGLDLAAQAIEEFLLREHAGVLGRAATGR